MSLQQEIDELMRVVNAIFISKAQNTDITKCTISTNMGTFHGRWFGKGQPYMRGFDFTTKSGNKIIPLRVLEQNPNKTDGYGNLKANAILARQGCK